MNKNWKLSAVTRIVRLDSKKTNMAANQQKTKKVQHSVCFVVPKRDSAHIDDPFIKITDTHNVQPHSFFRAAHSSKSYDHSCCCHINQCWRSFVLGLGNCEDAPKRFHCNTMPLNTNNHCACMEHLHKIMQKLRVQWREIQGYYQNVGLWPIATTSSKLPSVGQHLVSREGRGHDDFP